MRTDIEFCVRRTNSTSRQFRRVDPRREIEICLSLDSRIVGDSGQIQSSARFNSPWALSYLPLDRIESSVIEIVNERLGVTHGTSFLSGADGVGVCVDRKYCGPVELKENIPQ